MHRVGPVSIYSGNSHHEWASIVLFSAVGRDGIIAFERRQYFQIVL